jgi:Zn ribbon nucleic-acid-binding protein
MPNKMLEGAVCPSCKEQHYLQLKDSYWERPALLWSTALVVCSNCGYADYLPKFTTEPPAELRHNLDPDLDAVFDTAISYAIEAYKVAEADGFLEWYSEDMLTSFAKYLKAQLNNINPDDFKE